MPEYKAIFETVADGEVRKVRKTLILRDDDILSKIKERVFENLKRGLPGAKLRGEQPLHVIHIPTSRSINLDRPLPEQGIKEGDELLFTCWYENG